MLEMFKERIKEFIFDKDKFEALVKEELAKEKEKFNLELEIKETEIKLDELINKLEDLNREVKDTIKPSSLYMLNYYDYIKATYN